MPGASTDGEVEKALALIAQMSQEFASSRDVASTFEPALSKIVDHLDAEVGSLWLIEEDEVVCHASVGPSPITGLRLNRGEGIVGRTVAERTCQRILDARADPAFSVKADDSSGLVTRSLLCTPLAFGGEVIGAIQVINKRGGEGCFRESDVYPLRVMASSAALAISNARLAALLVEHERVRQDLELAAELQRSLLPQPPPMPFPIAAENHPARTVSGDFFDYFVLDEGRISFCLGDVAGKGINAALLMAKTSSVYRCLAKNIECPASLLRELNGELFERSTRGMFVTMLAGSYEVATGRVRLANAGHEPALQRDASGRFTPIGATSPPLGILPSSDGLASLTEVTVDLDGGALYVFSDGLTEALDADGREFGAAGVERLIDRHTREPLRERVQSMMSGVRRLRTRDDLTLLCVEDSRGAAE